MRSVGEVQRLQRREIRTRYTFEFDALQICGKIEFHGRGNDGEQ
jgi:hypothetical protein